MAQAHPILAGQQPFPGYCLKRRLAQGDSGEVWEAEVDDGKRLALKFMPCDEELNTTSKELRALQSIRQLRHQNLTTIGNVWSRPGYLIVAMELAEGSLADLLAASLSEFKQGLAADMILGYLMQVAKGLDFLNTRQHRLDGRVLAFQHCNVKPTSMLLFGETAKLADFGLMTPTTSRIQIHLTMGYLDYAAPETFQGALANQSDQYSLAVTYYELRTGQRPFPKVNSFRESWPLRRPAADLSLISSAERTVLASALSRIPQDRWPSCIELINELRKAAAAG